MRKTAWALIICLLAALLPFGAAASVGEEIVLEADFTGPLDTAYWQTTPNAFPEGKYIGTSQNPLSIRARTAPEGKSTLEISLLSDSSQNQDKNNWMTTYIGVRLSAASNMPTGADSGIFIAINNKKIGMRQGNWPETGSFAINYDFSKTRTLTIIDDVDKNEISIYADDDSGKKQLVATIEIVDGRTVNMYGANKAEGVKVTDTQPNEIPQGGYFSIFSHGCTTEIDHIKLTYHEYVREPYVAANPLLYQDVYADTWVATDDLGRKTPTFTEAGAPKDKKIGMFYLTWHDRKDGEIYDHSKAYAEGGLDAVWAMIPAGPLGYGHYWAEPYFGYYLSDDAWVIRRHAMMLSDAGVDFLFLDNSNSIIYAQTTTKIYEEYKKMRAEGLKTPQLMPFVIGSGAVMELWENFYKDDYYSDLWFRFDGKPVLLTNSKDELPAEVQEKFTFRETYNTVFGNTVPVDKNYWPWICDYPQTPGRGPNGEIEQMVVACGLHVNSSRGRSFHNGEEPTSGKGDFDFSLADTTSPLGLCYDEQFSEAFRVDPEVLMIIGWNEWWAGRWEGAAANGQTIASTYIVDPQDPVKTNYYVDTFNAEYSRDIEPMRGGYKDNYYWQTVQNVRAFRGVRPIPAAAGQKTINVLGPFSQWDGVWPEYRDTTGDTTPREHLSWASKYTYTNNSGRNDIMCAKVSSDEENWYFYVETKDDITQNEGNNWMNLYIDADQSFETGWKGYDFLLNRQQKDGKYLSVEKAQSIGWDFKNIGAAEYRIEGNKMQIRVPKAFLPLDEAAGFDFKWADNSVTAGEIMEFWDQGDAAPNGRFNFRYTKNAQQVPLSEALTQALEGGVAMEVNKNTAFLGGATVKVDEGNTAVCPFVYQDRTVVPVRFLAQSLGAQVSWDQESLTATITKGDDVIKLAANKNEMQVNGQSVALDVPAVLDKDRTFLPLRAISEALGQTVTWDGRGIIVIAPQEVTDEALLNEIWQKL